MRGDIEPRGDDVPLNDPSAPLLRGVFALPRLDFDFEVKEAPLPRSSLFFNVAISMDPWFGLSVTVLPSSIEEERPAPSAFSSFFVSSSPSSFCSGIVVVAAVIVETLSNELLESDFLDEDISTLGVLVGDDEDVVVVAGVGAPDSSISGESPHLFVKMNRRPIICLMSPLTMS